MDFTVFLVKYKLKLFLCILAFASTFPTCTCQTWTCTAAEQTAKSIDIQYNISRTTKNETVLVNICLEKTRDINKEIPNTVGKCDWAGDEEEFDRLRDKQKRLVRECDRVCSTMQQIVRCSNGIRYQDYVDNNLDEFCGSYYDSIRCKEKVLSNGNCSIADRVFERDMDNDIRNVFRFICNSGCQNITDAYQIIKDCSKQFGLKSISGCTVYNDFTSCLLRNTPCEEIVEMVTYFEPSYGDLREKCHTTISTIASTSIGSTVWKKSIHTTKVKYTATTTEMSTERYNPTTSSNLKLISSSRKFIPKYLTTTKTASDPTSVILSISNKKEISSINFARSTQKRHSVASARNVTSTVSGYFPWTTIKRKQNANSYATLERKTEEPMSQGKNTTQRDIYTHSLISHHTDKIIHETSPKSTRPTIMKVTSPPRAHILQRSTGRGLHAVNVQMMVVFSGLYAAFRYH